MALINCPDCGKEMSTEALTCLNCGRPLEKLNSDGKKELSYWGYLSIEIAVIAFYYLLDPNNVIPFFSGVAVASSISLYDIAFNHRRYNVLPSYIGLLVSFVTSLILFLF